MNDVKVLEQAFKWNESFNNKWKSAVPAIQVLKLVDLDAEREFEALFREWLESKSKDLQSKIHTYASAKIGIFDPDDGITEQEFKELQNDIKMEDASAEDQYEYARTFENKDPCKYVYWLEKSAKKKYGNAQNDLGVCYQLGRGVVQDCKKAFELYSLAANQGIVFAQYNTAVCYQLGRGVAQDNKKAFERYSLAANKGYGHAQSALGYLYQTGKGVTQSNKKAFELYTLAVDQGISEAQNNIGFYYKYGIVVPQDHKKAFGLYTLAAEQGLTEAQFNLGFCYETGLGTEINKQRAIELYTLARDQGHAGAAYNLELLPDELSMTS